MQRIVIIGSGGSGKSTLAKKLGSMLEIEVFHLDQIYWRPGWKALSHSDFITRQKAILTRPAWIIDGNYCGTVDLRLATADTVIVLDLPTIACLWQALERYLKYHHRTRPDMTPGNQESLTLEYLHSIFTYQRTRRPLVLKKMAGLPIGTEIFMLQSRAAIQTLLARISHEGFGIQAKSC